MKQLHFIINPISGKGKHKLTKKYLEKYFNYPQYNLVVKYTQYPKHATKLTQNSIKDNADIIVACGGDGTINEIASCLVKKEILLGIIPLGSGNGLASNLSISKNIEKAINIIKKGSIKKIDVGKINNNYFFSNTGVGFDADVIFNYDKMSSRSFKTYFKAVIKSFKNYKGYEAVEFSINNSIQVVKPFMIFISNSNIMGYNMSLTPNASLDDGYLDVVIIPQVSKKQILYLGLLFLTNKTKIFKHQQYLKTKHIVVQKKYSNYFFLQKDGEKHIVNNNRLDVSLFNKSLNVITP